MLKNSSDNYRDCTAQSLLSEEPIDDRSQVCTEVQMVT